LLRTMNQAVANAASIEVRNSPTPGPQDARSLLPGAWRVA